METSSDLKTFQGHVIVATHDEWGFVSRPDRAIASQGKSFKCQCCKENKMLGVIPADLFNQATVTIDLCEACLRRIADDVKKASSRNVSSISSEELAKSIPWRLGLTFVVDAGAIPMVRLHPTLIPFASDTARRLVLEAPVLLMMIRKLISRDCGPEDRMRAAVLLGAVSGKVIDPSLLDYPSDGSMEEWKLDDAADRAGERIVDIHGHDVVVLAHPDPGSSYSAFASPQVRRLVLAAPRMQAALRRLLFEAGGSSAAEALISELESP